MQLSIINEILILIIDKTYSDYGSNMCYQKTANKLSRLLAELLLFTLFRISTS